MMMESSNAHNIKIKKDRNKVSDIDKILRSEFTKCIKDSHNNLTRYQESKLKKNLYCESFLQFYELKNKKIINKKSLAYDIINFLEDSPIYFYGEDSREYIMPTDRIDKCINNAIRIINEEEENLYTAHIPFIKIFVLINLYADTCNFDGEQPIISPHDLKNILLKRKDKKGEVIEYLYRKEVYRTFLNYFTYQIGLNEEAVKKVRHIQMYDFYYRLDKGSNNYLSDTIYILLKYEVKYSLPHYSLQNILNVEGVNYNKIIRTFERDSLLNPILQDKKKSQWLDSKDNSLSGYKILGRLYKMRRDLTSYINDTSNIRMIDNIYTGPLYVKYKSDIQQMDKNNDLLCMTIVNIIGEDADKYLSWINGYEYDAKRHIEIPCVRCWQKNYLDWSSVARMITLISFETCARFGCDYQFEVAWTMLIESMINDSIENFYRCYKSICQLLINDQKARSNIIKNLNNIVNQELLLTDEGNITNVIDKRVIATYCYNNLNK